MASTGGKVRIVTRIPLFDPPKDSAADEAAELIG
jgi:hypothetical protein